MAYQIFSEGKDKGWTHIYYKIEYETARNGTLVGIRFKIKYSIDPYYWFGYNIYANVFIENNDYGRTIKENSPSSGSNELLFPENGDFYWFDNGYTNNKINGCRIIINSTNGGDVPFDTKDEGAGETVYAPTGYRASEISNNINFNVGENLRININDITNIDYQYTLRLDVLNDNNNWQTINTINTSSKNFEWNLSEFSETFYNSMVTKNKSEIRIILTTKYNNNGNLTEIGTVYKQGEVKITNSNPEPPSFFVDILSTYVVAMPNEFYSSGNTLPNEVHIIVDEKSLITKNGAKLSKINIEYANGNKLVDISDGFDLLSNIYIYYTNNDKVKNALKDSMDDIKVSVIDSRGNSSSSSQKIMVIPYDLPVITSCNLRRRNMIDTQVIVELTGEITLGIDWGLDVFVEISTKKWNDIDNTGTIYQNVINNSNSEMSIDTSGFNAEDPTTFVRRKFTITNFYCKGDLGAEGFNKEQLFYARVFCKGSFIDYTFSERLIFEKYTVFPTLEKGKCIYDITENGVSFGSPYEESEGGPLQINGKNIETIIEELVAEKLKKEGIS